MDHSHSVGSDQLTRCDLQACTSRLNVSGGLRHSGFLIAVFQVASRADLRARESSKAAPIPTLPCEGGTGTSTDFIDMVDAAFRQPPECRHPSSCLAHTRKRRVTHNPHCHLAARFCAVRAGKAPRLNQAGGWRFSGHAMRGEKGGKAENSGRCCLSAPSERSTAATAPPKIRAAHLGHDRPGR